MLIYHNIKAEKFNIPEENYDDLMYTFFSPDKEGWLQKQGGRLDHLIFIVVNSKYYNNLFI